MEKVSLETESFIIRGEENNRFFPFFELEYNEWVIYENGQPKYFFVLSSDMGSEYKLINLLTDELKKGKHLQNLIV